MKIVVLRIIVLLLWAVPCVAQERIYRCGNEYTNAVPTARTPGCKLVDGGNVTVVQGTRVKPASDKSSVSSVAPVSGARVDSQDQKARDSDSRLILQSELKKSEARQQELLKEYNNGVPEKRADETRNYQKYLDRVAEIKANLARNESDVAGIRRELSRLPSAASSK
jgi:hypothetical protein